MAHPQGAQSLGGQTKQSRAVDVTAILVEYEAGLVRAQGGRW